jgi:hypothetical protein
MITIKTFSPLTKDTVVSGPYDSAEILERFLSNKIRQFLRVKTRQSVIEGTLFSFGVMPPLKERNGTFSPAGVVIMKDGMPEIIRINRFVGTLASLAEPATFNRYLRKSRPDKYRP